MASNIDPICGKRPFWTGKRRDKWEECMELNKKIRESQTKEKESQKNIKSENDFKLTIAIILLTLGVTIVVIR